jgi:hypothetical protein
MKTRSPVWSRSNPQSSTAGSFFDAVEKVLADPAFLAEFSGDAFLRACLYKKGVQEGVPSTALENAMLGNKEPIKSLPQ